MRTTRWAMITAAVLSIAVVLPQAATAHPRRARSVGSITEYAVPTAYRSMAGLVTGPDGNLWVADSYANQILRVTTTGATTAYTTGEPGASPLNIAVGPDDNMWFTENGLRIGRITPTGSVTQIAIPDNGSHDIMAGANDDLWYATESIVAEVDTNGALGARFFVGSNPDLQGIALGPDGNLWVTERALGKIAAIDPGTGAVTQYSLASGPRSAPQDITVGADGALWFTEQGRRHASDPTHIGRITTDGQVTEYVLSGTVVPDAITAGPDGNVWFTTTSGAYIGVITVNGAATLYPGGLAGYGADIAAGPDGALWFTGPGASSLGRITTDGADSMVPVAPYAQHPSGIAASHDRTLWYTFDDGSWIGRTETTGAPESSLSIAGPARQLALGADGKSMWATEFIENQLTKVRLKHGQVTQSAYPAPTPSAGLFGVCTGPDGNEWFTEAAANAMGRVTPQEEWPSSPSPLRRAALKAAWLVRTAMCGSPKGPGTRSA